MINYFLSHIREVFKYNLFKYFLSSFLFLFFFWDRYNWNVGAFNVVSGERRRWRKNKMQRSPSSPQIHQKYIYTWNGSYRTPTEHWQKTSELPKGKKLPTYLGRAKEKETTETKE